MDGGSPITGYYIEKKSGSRWVKVNKKSQKDTTLTLDDLDEGTTYEYRVFAENEAGQGKPCAPVSFVAKDPFDKPGRPGRPDVEEITGTTATIAWQPPESDGGSPVTNYIIEKRVAGEKKWQRVNKEDVTDLTYEIPDLEEETEYEFRVTAENKAGQGEPSEPSKAAKYGRNFKSEYIYVCNKHSVYTLLWNTIISLSISSPTHL